MRNGVILASLLLAIPARAQDAGLKQIDVLTGDVTRVAPGRVVYEADVLNTCAAAANVRFSATPPGVGGTPMARSLAAIAPQATRTFSYAETVEPYGSGTTTGEVSVTDKPTETVITESPGVCKTVTTQCKAQPNMFSWTVLVQAAETRAPSGVRLKLRATLAETRTERPTPCPPPASTQPQAPTTPTQPTPKPEAAAGLEYPVTPVPGANPGTGVDEDNLFGGEADPKTPWYMNKWILTGVAATAGGIVIGASGGGSGPAQVTGPTTGAPPPATTGTPTTGATPPAPAPAPAPAPETIDGNGTFRVTSCRVISDPTSYENNLQFCSSLNEIFATESGGNISFLFSAARVPNSSGPFNNTTGAFSLNATGTVGVTSGVGTTLVGRINALGLFDATYEIGINGTLPGQARMMMQIFAERRR